FVPHPPNYGRTHCLWLAVAVAVQSRARDREPAVHSPALLAREDRRLRRPGYCRQSAALSAGGHVRVPRPGARLPATTGDWPDSAWVRFVVRDRDVADPRPDAQLQRT